MNNEYTLFQSRQLLIVIPCLTRHPELDSGQSYSATLVILLIKTAALRMLNRRFPAVKHRFFTVKRRFSP